MKLKGMEPRLAHEYGSGWRFSFHVEEESLGAAKQLVDDLKDGYISAEVMRWKNQRSLDANAYFHVLCGKLAEQAKTSMDETKVQLVLRYGSFARGKDGKYDAVKIPESVDVSAYYPYAKWFGESEDKGVKFNHYLFMKRTHTLDSGEMARLIDGTIADCKESGIETLPPAELERMKNSWAR